MHILVVGFSVTAEHSFVEICRERLGQGSTTRIDKAGIGGWFPFLLRHVIGEILDQYRPDHVVFEIATPSLRGQDRPHADHLDSIRCLAATAVQRGARRVSFLDLPRSDVDEATDWMWPMHRDFCAAHGLGYAAVPLRDGMLRDVVHPSDAGKQAFADALMALLETPDIPDDARAALTAIRNPYGSIPAHRYGRGSAGLRDYARSGYEVTPVRIPAGDTVRFDFGQPVRVLGYSMLIGPASGALTLTAGETTHRAEGHDAFCYYERIAATFFAERACTSLTIRQEPEQPGIALLKGEVNTGPRMGHICSFFVAGDVTPPATVPGQGAPDAAPPAQTPAPVPVAAAPIPVATPAPIPADRQHALVVGFSVTDQHSFVEFARKRCANAGRPLRIDKVGIGAWTPWQLRHVIGYLLDLYGKPDHLILEIATSQLRGQGRPRADHMDSLRAICAEATARGASRISFFDLPRRDVTEQGDWLWQMHRDFAAEHRMGHVAVPLQDGMLRDEVHPTEPGKQIYTDAFMRLLDTPEMPPAIRDRLRAAPAPYDCIPAPDCAVGQPVTRPFGRGGFDQTVVGIPGGSIQRFDFGGPVQLVGYTMLLGPRTGALTAVSGGFSHRYKGYDPYCYYERLGITLFEPRTLSTLTIRQEPEVPDTALLKGDKDGGPRLGHIGAFLIRREDGRAPLDRAADAEPHADRGAPPGRPAQPAPALTALTGQARGNRLIHLHQPRTAGRSLRQAFADHLGAARVVGFQPGAPDAVQDMLDADAWQVFTGGFMALHGKIAGQLLKLPCWMTVVRDPAERLVSFLHYARAVPALGAWHDRLKPLAPRDGLALLVSEGSSYAQSSQCRAIAWGEDAPTASGARRAIDRRYRMVCTMEQLPAGFEALKRWGLVAPDAVLPHVFAGPPIDAALLADARQILAEHAAEDAALHRMLLQGGPVLRDSPAGV